MKLIGRSKVFFVVETHCGASKSVETGFKHISTIGFLKNRIENFVKVNLSLILVLFSFNRKKEN